MNVFPAIGAVIKPAAALPAGCWRGPEEGGYLGAVRCQHLARHEIEVDLCIVYFDPRRVGLVSNSEVNGQVVSCAPIILEVRSKNAGALAPFASANAPAIVYGLSEIEVCAAVTPSATGGWSRGCENPT